MVDRIKEGEWMNEKKQALYDTMQEYYNKIWDKLAETSERLENKIFVKVNNYRPIKISWKDMDWVPSSMQDDASIWETMKENYMRKSIQKWFLKQAKGGKVIPITDANMIFHKHLDDALYYIRRNQ